MTKSYNPNDTNRYGTGCGVYSGSVLSQHCRVRRLTGGILLYITESWDGGQSVTGVQQMYHAGTSNRITGGPRTLKEEHGQIFCEQYRLVTGRFIVE